ncbi:MAG: CHAT domain-containing protein [Bacteroidia bacterium]|nr:CHAT domain-containing protein [Bacteroidia bacterium]
MPDTLSLQVYLRGAEAWGSINKPTEALHGYFAGGGKNPLLAGGLLLAQAAVWDSLLPPFGIDDGRLTAQEAFKLNLIDTELVVLSACETGLGEVRGEGLYGLQQALLEAGAQWVITTLWQIDDQATQDLMLSFYRNWTKRKRAERVDEVFNRTFEDLSAEASPSLLLGGFRSHALTLDKPLSLSRVGNAREMDVKSPFCQALKLAKDVLRKLYCHVGFLK